MVHLAALVLHLFFSPFSIQTAAAIPYDYQHILAAEQPLQAVNEDGDLRTICTTTAIGDGYHWLTAAHCTGGETYINGEPAAVVYRNETSDLSVLKTLKSHANPLKMQGSRPHVGDHVYMVGHPLGLPPQYFQGHISSLGTKMDDDPETFMMFDMLACGGNSGSAVVNGRDEIVSVLQIGFGRPCSSFSGGAQWAPVAYIVLKYGRD